MRKLGCVGLALALVLASRGFADDEEPAKKPAPSRSAWGRLFSRSDPQEELDKLVDAQEAKAQRQVEEIKARQESLKAAGRRAYDGYLRREAVLDRIQELAVAAGDMQLSARIEGLRERAFAVYQKKKNGQTDKPAGPEQTREGKP